MISEKEFYNVATSGFSSSYANITHDFLTIEENCLLEKSVKNDLEAIGKPGRIVFNDIIILKTFIEPNLEMPFSFVYNSRIRKMYLIIMPHLYKTMYDISRNYEELEDKYVLKNARELIPLNSESFSSFLWEVTGSEAFGLGFTSQMLYSKEVLSDILPFFDCNYISRNQFLRDLTNEHKAGNLSDSVFEKIQSKVLKEPGHKTEWQFIHVEWLGHVLCEYQNGNNGIKFSMYLLPALEGTKITRARHTLEECSRGR